MDECKPLANGLRYVVLPNNVPGDRFEAHLEMHVGSVDERPDEQGLAHLAGWCRLTASRPVLKAFTVAAAALEARI